MCWSCGHAINLDRDALVPDGFVPARAFLISYPLVFVKDTKSFGRHSLSNTPVSLELASRASYTMVTSVVIIPNS